MRIVFLDVDGVMNSHRHFAAMRRDGRPPVPQSVHHLYHSGDGRMPLSYHFDPEAMAALNHIIEKTRARVVISSTWRDWKLTELHQHFAWQGYRGPRFFSRTPNGGGVATALDKRHGFKLAQGSSIIYASISRGAEIDWWLKNVGIRHCVTSHVILDDESSMAMHTDRLVQTDAQFGLTMAQAERAVAMLS
jgi:hypothetical protein